MKIVTWNIRCQNSGDEARGCGWVARLPRVAEALGELRPDVLAVQEAYAPQMDDLRAALPDFASAGVGRADGERAGEFCGIFWRQDRFELRAGQTRWLSPTPAVPSFGWGAACVRICTRARLFDRQTKREFEVWNAHLDHQSALARLQSARLLRGELEALEVPGLLCGDFNAAPTDPPIRDLTSGILRDARAHCQTPPQGNVATFRGFDAPLEGETHRIDYVFATPAWEIGSYRVPAMEGQWPPASDHRPVVVEVELGR